MKIAFTIATSNYLAQAKTMADSLLAYNPEYNFIIVLLDKQDNISAAFFNNVTFIEVEDINIPYFDEMVGRYSIFELSNALKPFCADFFLNYHNGINDVLYFDSDIKVYSKLTEVDDLLKSYSIIITPHILQSPPYDGLSLNENDFLNTGIYNGGFFAVTTSKESHDFLDWWKERMRKQCLVDLAKGLFVDQIWLNLVPIYFKRVKILDNVGYNVAYWNLHERQIENTNGIYYVNQFIPLVFFHFSGFFLEEPDLISRFQNRYTFEQREDIRPLFESYLNSVKGNQYEKFSLLTCYYSQVNQPFQNDLPATNASTGFLSAFKKKIKRTLSN